MNRNRVVWIVQGLLAALFLFAGGMKLLTSLAAAGLVVIMVGATVSTLAIGGGVLALPTLVLGLLAALVAHGRRPQAPHAGMTRPALRLAH